MSYILNSENTELIISLTAPYKNVKQILSYEDVLEFNMSIYYDLDKFFRFSFNDINYSNWVDLTDNLVAIFRYLFSFLRLVSSLFLLSRLFLSKLASMLDCWLFLIP